MARDDPLEVIEVARDDARRRELAAIIEVVQRRDRFLAEQQPRVLRHHAAGGQPVDALERAHLRAQLGRGLEQLDEAATVDLENAQLGLGDDGRAAPRSPHERQLPHAAPGMHAREQDAVAIGGRRSGQDQVDAFGLLTLTEEHRTRGDRPLRGVEVDAERADEARAAGELLAPMPIAQLEHVPIRRALLGDEAAERLALEAHEHGRLGRAHRRRVAPGRSREHGLLPERAPGASRRRTSSRPSCPAPTTWTAPSTTMYMAWASSPSRKSTSPRPSLTSCR